MVLVTLTKEDFTNPLHPYMWEEMLEQLANAFFDLPERRADYPDTVTIRVSSATVE